MHLSDDRGRDADRERGGRPSGDPGRAGDAGLRRALRQSDDFEQQMKLLMPRDGVPPKKQKTKKEGEAPKLDIAALVARFNATGVKAPGGDDRDAGADREEMRSGDGASDSAGSSGQVWDALVRTSPTIEISSRRGRHTTPLGTAKELPIGAALDLVARAMELDDERVEVTTPAWEDTLDAQDPAWWENLLAAMGGAFAYALYDYIAFNAFAFNQGDERQLQYRLFQAPTQIFIHRWLSQNVSPQAAAAFEVIWWTWGCDLMFYAIAELGLGQEGWHGPGSFEGVSRAKVTWASWTPMGIVAGLGNLINGEPWTEPLDGGQLILQSLVGVLVAAGVSMLTRADLKALIDALGFGFLEDAFTKNGMDLYAAVTTSLENPSVEAGITYQPDSQTELHAGLGTDDKDGFFGTLGVQYLSEQRDWLLRVGLTLDKDDVGLYADWQKRVGAWNLFVGTRLRDEYFKLGGGAELDTHGMRLSGKVSWDTREKWLASLKIAIDL